jgi:hypothetical protein
MGGFIFPSLVLTLLMSMKLTFGEVLHSQFGKLFIAVCTGFIAALIIVGGSMNDISHAPLFSITIIMLLAFAVGSAFMDVWVRENSLTRKFDHD